MIVSFRSKALEAFFQKNDRRRLRADMVERIRSVLTVIDQALDVDDIDVPTFRLHRLRGDLKGVWSVTVRANWRIIFRFENGDAYDVDLVDYH